MNNNEKQQPFRILISITTPKLADKAAEMFILDNIPLQYECVGRGTAPNEMIDVLGLGSPEKVVLLSFMPKSVSDNMLKKLKKELKLGTVNSGIAFTLPIKGATSLIVKMFEGFNQDEEKTAERKVNLVSDNNYYLIAAVVNQGYSESVMEAAREAGAGGGTVVPSRSIVNEKAIGFWGTTIQDEKEIILIVSDDEKRLDIMQAISSKCGMHSEAKGLIAALPLDNVIGIDRED